MKSNRIAEYLFSCVSTQVNNKTAEQLRVLPRKRGEQAEVGRTRLFPLALRGKADSRIPQVYFSPAFSCIKRKQYTQEYTRERKLEMTIISNRQDDER
jgi:hypothetical protein